MQPSVNDTVSIIIPAYNAGKFIEETVASAMASTYPYIEIIIVNDGSTDNTAEVLTEINRRYPEIKIVHQENSGVAVARNLAIRMATGKYILPLDADDLISVSYIEKAVAVISANDDIKVVYSKAEFFGDKKGNWKLPAFKLKLLARKNLIFVSGMYRKSDYEKTDGYRPEIKGPEDWDFWISMLKDGGKVYQIPEVCFYYRIHPASKRVATRNKKKEGIDLLNQRHKAFMYKSLGGKLHYIRQLSELFNFFAQFAYSLKVLVNPRFKLLEDDLYHFSDTLSKQIETADKSRSFETIIGNYCLRVEVFESLSFFKWIKPCRNATQRFKMASACVPADDGFAALGCVEQYFRFFKYRGFFIEIKLNDAIA